MLVKSSVVLAASCVLFCAAPAWAQDVTYTGDGSGLQNLPDWFGQLPGSLFPGTTATPGASGNTVTINYDPNSGIHPEFVFGGLSENGEAAGNKVVMLNGRVTLYVYGGASQFSAKGNTVTISGGQVVNSVYGGSSTDDVTDNIVTISNAQVGWDAYGGFSSYSGAKDNTVTISDSEVTGNVYGGWGKSGDAKGNTATISGGQADSVYGGYNETGDATGNTVTINGGQVTSNVYGGMSYYGSATGNTVTISGAPHLSEAIVWGGCAVANPSSDSFTGNTLNVKSAGLTVKAIYNFQNYNFYLPGNLEANDVMLYVAGPVNVDNTSVNVGIAGGSSLLQKGDTVVLIDSPSLAGFPTNTTANGQGMQGVSLLYGFTLSANASQLLAEVTSTGINPQAKALSEGRAGNLSFLRQGADLVSGDGLKNAWGEAKEADGKVSFSALQGGSSRYKTGSHVDVNGVSLLTGVASRRTVANGDIMTGIFLEAGWGSYDSYNSFTNLPSVKGGGDTNYYGLGFLARSEKTGGAYTEGSLRLGRTKADFASGDLRDALDQAAGYDSSSNYWGAHLGIGKIKTSGKNTLDVYGKYLFTHQNGDDVNVLGDSVSFSGADSHRLKTGFRISRKTSDKVTTYAGASYEYEFDGKSKATTNGFDIDAPSVKGSTGVLELGAQWKKGGGDTLELGLLGYVGKRQGLSGTLQFKHVF